MYTPPVTPWESEMPEVGDLTPSKHDVVTTKRSFVVSVKKYGTESVVFSRGKELPKAGMITGVKS